MIKIVKIAKPALKDLNKAPMQVQFKFNAWVKMVSENGLEQIRRISGFHDEPLQGKLKGIRSIRLNDQWRAFYIISKDDEVQFVEVRKVTPHEYKP